MVSKDLYKPNITVQFISKYQIFNQSENLIIIEYEKQKDAQF